LPTSFFFIPFLFALFALPAVFMRPAARAA
jgi:hypothetical protein